MNCTEFRKMALLAHSGECPDAKVSRMQAHRDVCPACRTYEDDLQTIARALQAESARTVAGPSEATLRRIVEQARLRTPQPIPEWRLALRPLAGLAAGLTLILGLWIVPRSNHTPAPDAVSTANGAGTFTSILALVLNHETVGHPVLPTDRDAMARHILMLQGISELPEPNETMEPEELQPTSLLRRNTPEAPVEIRG